MLNSQILLAVPMLLVIVSLTACNAGDRAGTPASDVVLSIPDPVQPVAIDVSIGGSFEGDPGNPPADIEPESAAAIVFRDADTNSLTSEEIAQAPDFNLDRFAAAFDAVQGSQPNLPHASDEFARAIIAELRKANPEAGLRPLMEKHAGPTVFDVFNNLTPAEKALVVTNPYKAYKTKAASAEALAVAGAILPGDQYLTRADAFRHSYWNWLMSKCCTVEWATAFATAHESQTPNNDDKRMDLNNNMIGRRVFSQSPQAAPASAQAALLDYQLLWINSRQKNVTVGVDYLIYLEPAQTVKVFDDGPVYDDIYTVKIAGKAVGDTPAGGSKAFEFDQMPSGTHAMDILCNLDGTKGGCGFAIHLRGALTLPSGGATTPQIVIQETQIHSTSMAFPTMTVAKTN